MNTHILDNSWYPYTKDPQILRGRQSQTQLAMKHLIYFFLSDMFKDPESTAFTAVWGIMKLVQLQLKSFLNKNLPSLIIYVHKNQCQLFHISNGIMWLTNWITLVHLNSFRPINLFLHPICVSFKNTLYIKNTLLGVLAVSWGPEILI